MRILKPKHFFGQGGGAITAKSLNTVFLREIPVLSDVRQGGDYGVPIVISNEESAPSEAIKRLGVMSWT